MKRFLSCLLIHAVTLLTTSQTLLAQSFPVDHEQPMMVRVMDGQADRPMAQVHLLLVAGYDHKDLQTQYFHEELLTDGQGQALLPRGISNLPWLQVWVADAGLCQAKFRSEDFSVERIRADGYTAPNRCGTVIGENEPGILTIFAVKEWQKHPTCKKTQKAWTMDVRKGW